MRRVAILFLFLLFLHCVVAPSSPFFPRRQPRYRSLLRTFAPQPTTTPQSYPRSFRIHSNVPKGTQINRSVGMGKKAVILDATRPLPCCKDESGGGMCRSLKTHDPRGCANEADFSLVLCCKSCDDIGIAFRERAQSFFTEQTNTTNCFDRMSLGFCSRFAKSADTWSARRWSCDSEHYRLGFRVCRQTCGFCNLDWLNARETLKCTQH